MLSFTGQSCFYQHLLHEADWTLFLQDSHEYMLLHFFTIHISNYVRQFQ